MDPEHVINLFDSYWFNYEILKKKPNVSRAKTDNSELKFSSLRSILVRSQSEDMGNSFNYGSFSPISVLKPIPSLKQDFTTQKPKQEHEHKHEHEQDQVVVQVQEPETYNNNNKNKKKRRVHGTSKSLSDLEFEELKGFMDMGFVFSEQDYKDSSLVEIIPGLQRLGEVREDDDNDDDNDDSDKNTCVDDEGERRPYLSEAWEDLDRKLKIKEVKITSPMMKWEIPAVKDEIDMKDNLKLWAHTIASIVR